MRVIEFKTLGGAEPDRSPGERYSPRTNSDNAGGALSDEIKKRRLMARVQKSLLLRTLPSSSDRTLQFPCLEHYEILVDRL